MARNPAGVTRHPFLASCLLGGSRCLNSGGHSKHGVLAPEESVVTAGLEKRSSAAKSSPSPPDFSVTLYWKRAPFQDHFRIGKCSGSGPWPATVRPRLP